MQVFDQFMSSEIPCGRAAGEKVTVDVLGKQVGGQAGGNLLSWLTGKTYNMYLLELTLSNSKRRVVVKRYRELRSVLHNVADERLRQLFPTKSVLAAMNIPCAVRSRQKQLNAFMRELSSKVPEDKLLTWLEVDTPSRSSTPVRKATPSPVTSPFRRRDSSPPRCDGSPVSVDSAFLLASAKDLVVPGADTLQPPCPLERLRDSLMKGIRVVKIARNGTSASRTLTCDPDFTFFFWTGKAGTDKRFKFSDVRDVRVGPSKKPFDNLTNTLSIAMPGRSVDLQALTEGDFHILRDGFAALLPATQSA